MGAMWRWGRGWAAAVTALVVVGGPPPSAQASPDHVVPPEAFGIHSFHGRPEVPAGSIRMNCSPPWFQVNPAAGVWQWADADRRMQSAAQWAENVMYVFCGTPRWAAGPINSPKENWYGEGSNAPPAQMSYWRDYVTAIVDRYGHLIDDYQMWNEASTRFMWQGTPRMMAQMTVVAAQIINERDPTATIVAPSLQLTVANDYRQFSREYLQILAHHDWPIDVMSIHTYVQGDESVSVRVTRARTAIRYFRTLGVPARVQFWDTETNVLRDVSRTRQAAFVARAFLDSWRSGITRTYWYHYTFTPDDFVGIDMRPGDISQRSYRAIVSWTVGATYRGCTQRHSVVACSFRSPTDRPFTILYALRHAHPYRLATTSRTRVLLTSPRRTQRGWILVPVTPMRVWPQRRH